MKKPFVKNVPWTTNYNALKKLPHKQIVLFACDVARLVFLIFEQQYPEDKRPRTVIETTELFVYGQVKKDQLKEAYIASSTAYYATYHAVNTVYNVDYHATYNAAHAAYHAANATYHAAYHAVNAAYSACNSYVSLYPTIQTIFQQTTPITIPTTPILQAIAYQIVTTRNFQEYNILLDNLEEVHNITLERTIPKGLSHYVLYTLTNTH